MLTSDVSFIEFELSSYCNAACPGCPRTQIEIGQFPSGILEKRNQTLAEIKKVFGDEYLRPSSVKFCGNLGDPLMNPEILEITEFFLERGSNVKINTNGGAGSEALWKELGLLNVRYTKKLKVVFAIDGLETTNHIYRVNVVWNKLMKNIVAYMTDGGQGEWHYIVFDHNKDSVKDAEILAGQLGLKFFMRKSTRNFVTFVNKNQERITSTETTIHDHIDEYRQIKPALKKLDHINAQKSAEESESSVFTSMKLTEQERKTLDHLSANIDCWNVHKNQLFVDSQMRVWPCCHFSDMNAKREEMSFLASLPGEKDWNSLRHFSLKEILAHTFFQTIEKRWQLDSPLFTQRCIVACGGGGKFKSSIQQISPLGAVSE